MRAPRLLIRKSAPHRNGRIACHNRIWWNVTRNDRTRGDKRALADRDTTQDDTGRANPNITSDVNCVARCSLSIEYPRRKTVGYSDFVFCVIVTSDDLNVHADKNVVADLSADRDDRVPADGNIVSNDEL